MDRSGNTKVKNASEIGALAGRLNVHNQFYVLNTINFFLSGQNMQKTHRSKAAEEICLKEKRKRNEKEKLKENRSGSA